jgi:hypothetical protein
LAGSKAIECEDPKAPTGCVYTIGVRGKAGRGPSAAEQLTPIVACCHRTPVEVLRVYFWGNFVRA